MFKLKKKIEFIIFKQIKMSQSEESPSPGQSRNQENSKSPEKTFSSKQKQSKNNYKTQAQNFQSDANADLAGKQYTMYLVKTLYDISEKLPGIKINDKFQFNGIINNSQENFAIAKSILQNLNVYLSGQVCSMIGIDQWKQCLKFLKEKDIQILLKIITTYIQPDQGSADKKKVEGDFDLIIREAKLQLQDELKKFFEKKESQYPNKFWLIQNYLETQNINFSKEDQAVYVFQLKKNPFGERKGKLKESKPVRTWAKNNDINLKKYIQQKKSKIKNKSDSANQKNIKEQTVEKPKEIEKKQQSKNQQTQEKIQQQQLKNSQNEQKSEQLNPSKKDMPKQDIQNKAQIKRQQKEQFEQFRQKFLSKLFANNMLENIAQIIKLIYAAAEQFYRIDQKNLRFDFYHYRSMRNLNSFNFHSKTKRTKHHKIVLYYVVNHSLTKQQFREKFDFFKPILKHLFIYEKAILHIVGCNPIEEKQILQEMQLKIAKIELERIKQRNHYQQKIMKLESQMNQMMEKLNALMVQKQI